MNPPSRTIWRRPKPPAGSPLVTGVAGTVLGTGFLILSLTALSEVGLGRGLAGLRSAASILDLRILVILICLLSSLAGFFLGGTAFRRLIGLKRYGSDIRTDIGDAQVLWTGEEDPNLIFHGRMETILFPIGAQEVRELEGVLDAHERVVVRWIDLPDPTGGPYLLELMQEERGARVA